LVVPDTAETTALGAAISAAVGCGMCDDFRKAVHTMVSIRKSYEPIAKNAVRYDKFYTRAYQPFYERVADLMHRVAEINDEEQNGG
jgi:xylulokinase